MIERPADEADELAELPGGGADVGADTGADDLGDPLARMRSSAQLRESATSLAALAPDERSRRSDPDRMTVLEIFPARIRHRADAAVLDQLPRALADRRAPTAAAVVVVRVA